MQTKIQISVPLLLILFISAIANGLVNVDFEYYADTTTFDANAVAGGGFWNRVTTNLSDELLDADENETYITVNVSGGQFAHCLWNPNLADDLLNDYFLASSSGGVLEISGLHRWGKYNLYVYSSMARKSPYIPVPLDTDWTVQGVSRSISGLASDDMGPYYNAEHQGVTWEKFEITTDDIGMAEGRFCSGPISSIDEAILNGIQIEGPLNVCAPNPNNGTSGVCVSTTLSWVSPQTSVSHNVYIGTDFNYVNNADDPNVAPGVGITAGNSYDPQGLEAATTYYWRVDFVDSNNNITKGSVWQFTTTYMDFLETIETSSVQDESSFFEAENIADNDWLSQWQAQGGTNEWIKIYFNRQVRVGGLVLVDQANQSGNAGSIEISFSDQQSINYIFPVSPNYQGRNQSGTVYNQVDAGYDAALYGAQYIRFANVHDSNFVKIKITGLIDANKPASLAEIRIVEVPSDPCQPQVSVGELETILDAYNFTRTLPEQNWIFNNEEFTLEISRITGLPVSLQSTGVSPAKTFILNPSLYIRNIERGWTDNFDVLEGYRISSGSIDGEDYNEITTLIRPELYNIACATIRYRIFTDRIETQINTQYLADDWCRYRIGFYSNLNTTDWPLYRDTGWWKNTNYGGTDIKTYSHELDSHWEQGDWHALSIPMGVFQRDDRILMFGSFDLGPQIVFAENIPVSGSWPSVFLMPMGIESGQTDSFNLFYKTFDRLHEDWMEALRWYCQRTFFDDSDMNGIDVKLSQNNPRTIPPGQIVPAHVPAYTDVLIDGTPFTESYNKIMDCENWMLRMGMIHLWYAEWDLWVHSPSDFTIDSVWNGYRGPNLSAAGMRDEIERLKNKGFRVYAYMNQYISPPWVQGRLIDPDNDLERQWYINRAKQVITVLNPSGIGWDCGWWSLHWTQPNQFISSNPKGDQNKGWLKIQAHLYQWLKENYPDTYVIGNNEGSGPPSQYFTDAVFVEGGGIASYYIVSDSKALMTPVGSYFHCESEVDSILAQHSLVWNDVINSDLPGSVASDLWDWLMGYYHNSLGLGCSIGGHPLNLVAHEYQRRKVEPLYFAKTACYLPQNRQVATLSNFSAIANSTPTIARTYAITTDTPEVFGSVWANDQRVMASLHNESTGSANFTAQIDRSMLSEYGFNSFADSNELPHAVILQNDGIQSSRTLNVSVDQNLISLSGQLSAGESALLLPEFPKPYCGEADVSIQHLLQWTGDADTAASDIYFGTDANAVALASDANVLPGRGRTSLFTYNPSIMSPATAYYWRVDKINDSGIKNKGLIWSFTTAAPEVIFADGFESNFNKWTDGGTTDWDRTTGQKYSGSYSAHAGSADNDLISDNINSSGFYSMTIIFWYRDDDIDADDDVYLQLYDGANYDNKFELDTATEDVWCKYEVTLYNSGGDAQYFIPNFRLKFEGTSIDSGENLWIDDVSLTLQR